MARETIYASVTSTSYTDTDVTKGVTYYYEIAAVDRVGPGPLSSEVRAIAR